MTDKNKWVYAVAYTRKKNSMVGHPFSTRKQAEKHIPLYRSKGWTGGVVRLAAPKPLSDAERADLEQLSKFTKALNGLLRRSL